MDHGRPPITDHEWTEKRRKNPRKIDRESTTKRTENRPQNAKVLMPASLKSIYRERQRFLTKKGAQSYSPPC
jgi:hypothetical protein